MNNFSTFFQSPMASSDPKLKTESNMQETPVEGHSSPLERSIESFSDSGYEFSSSLRSCVSDKFESSGEWSCSFEGKRSGCTSQTPCFEGHTPKLSILPFVKPKVLFRSPNLFMSTSEPTEIPNNLNIKVERCNLEPGQISPANEVATHKESHFSQVQIPAAAEELYSANSRIFTACLASENDSTLSTCLQQQSVELEKICKQENCNLKPPIIPFKAVKPVSQRSNHIKHQKKMTYVKTLFTEESHLQSHFSLVWENGDTPPSSEISRPLIDMTDCADKKLADADIPGGSGARSPIKRNAGSKKKKASRGNDNEDKENATVAKLGQCTGKNLSNNKRDPFAQMNKNIIVKVQANTNVNII